MNDTLSPGIDVLDHNLHSMFARLSQLSRHFSRPLLNYAHPSATASSAFPGNSIMTSVTAEEKTKRMIHTAGCIIIGDEVLGGKVCPNMRFDAENLHS